MHIFYDHIVKIHHIYSEIELLIIDNDQKNELIEIIEETIHHHILHRILDHLHQDHHHKFLEDFHKSPSDLVHLEFLISHNSKIEDHIKEAAEEIKYELLKAIRES